MEKECEISGYMLKKKIGQGSFGQVYEAEKKGQLYAIKIEHIATVKPMAALEYQIYQQLQRRKAFFSRGQNFPQAFEYIQKEYFSYLVMQKLDVTLQDLVNLKFKNQMEKDTFILIIYNTLKCLEQIHQLGYVYRDVKPSNFMLKNAELQVGKSQICLIDLGLCKKYLKKESQQHIALKTNKKMIGTPIFCSINTHKGFQISRRDDLQAWLYMTAYFAKKLPWEDLVLKNKLGLQNRQQRQNTYKEILKAKQEINFINFLKQEKKLPTCLSKIYEHIKDLQFQARPNYEFIYNLLEQQYRKLTDLKNTLSQLYFTTKSAITSEKMTKVIKIQFKMPQKKKPTQIIDVVTPLDPSSLQ